MSPKANLVIVLLVAAGPSGSVGWGQEKQADVPEAKQLREYSVSLKGDLKKGPAFRLAGPQAEQCVKLEAAGMRLTLPTGFAGTRPDTGLFTGIVVKGDFEISVRFEILHFPGPDEPGIQTRFALSLPLDKKKNDRATLSRLFVRGAGSGNYTWLSAWDETTGKTKTRAQLYSAGKEKSGRLRLARSGGVLAYSVAEGDGDFMVLQKVPIGPGDLQDVGLVGGTGNPQVSLDVRFTDLRIRAQALANLPADARPKGAPDPR